MLASLLDKGAHGFSYSKIIWYAYEIVSHAATNLIIFIRKKFLYILFRISIQMFNNFILLRF